MIEIELDGQKVEVPEGSMVMHAADKAGTYIPHFCYHKKLSIAANCRMCLVEVEKAPKPMPACATPVAKGMVVHTKSDKALKAQQSVMEFLLINHPLDCPICDQGGECQLQDLAVGYGASSSRYDEEKRVVYPKDFSPLISAREMNRCIHCTRCVRFGQELAGVMELGMIHRGEHSEITTVAGDTVDSELSGNMIDLCPVGALTSKPFRYSARTWELSRRKSVSPHDSTGANLIVQVKNHRVMRVLPLENERVNECWLADRDRFAYLGLNSADRLTTPMIKQAGEWTPVDWTTALEYVARSLTQIRAEHGAQAVGAIGSPYSTCEELHLLGKLVRGFGSANVDHRLRHADFSNAAPAGSARWLGRPIASLSELQRVLVVGSFLRKDHPLFALRLRQAAKKGAQVHRIGAVADDWLLPVAGSLLVRPSEWPRALGSVCAAVAELNDIAPPAEGLQADDASRAVAKSLISGEGRAILLGNAAAQHPQAGTLLALAHWLGERTGASVGYLGEAGNAVGAQWVGALPGEGGLDAGRMLGGGEDAPRAMLLLNVEPALDAADGAAAAASLRAADFVVAMTPFASTAADVADVLLPVAPFTETSGTFVNAEGRVQSFHGVVKPLGDTRPAWKVLRVLGNLLGLSGFAHETSDEVRIEALGADTLDDAAVKARLDNAPAAGALSTAAPAAGGGIERIAEVPIYSTDAIVRRSLPLQQTADALPPVAAISPETARQYGIDGDAVRVSVQGGEAALLPLRIDAAVAAGCLRLPAAHPLTAMLGAQSGPVRIEKVAASAAASPTAGVAVA